jgi:triacylglycerol lipase
LAVRNNPVTDYQGTVYRDVRTNEIVVAHRGTANVTDGIIDLAMVINSVNYQAAESKK